MSAIVRKFTVLGLLILIAPGALRAGEASLEPVRLTGKQRRDLETLIFNCQVKLAERAGGLEEIKARLLKAEKSAEWYKRRAAGAAGAADAAGLKTGYLSMSAQLAAAYGRALQKARAQKAAGTARELLAVRSRSLEALRESAWAETPAGRLWLAEQFLAASDYFEARRDYRTLLDKFDPDGDGKRLPDGKLIGPDELRAALQGSRRLTTVDDLGEARERLDQIDLCRRGRPERRRGERVLARALDRDYARAVRLIEKFLQDYPGYGLGPDGKPGKARKAIKALKDELEFRCYVMRARTGLITCCTRLGREALKKSGAEKAAERFREGVAEAAGPLKHRPRDAELRLDYAECLLGAGSADKARAEYFKLRRGLKDGGALWWRATRGLWRAHRAAGDPASARRLLDRLEIDCPRSIKKHFPELAR